MPLLGGGWNRCLFVELNLAHELSYFHLGGISGYGLTVQGDIFKCDVGNVMLYGGSIQSDEGFIFRPLVVAINGNIFERDVVDVGACAWDDQTDGACLRGRTRRREASSGFIEFPRPPIVARLPAHVPRTYVGSAA